MNKESKFGIVSWVLLLVLAFIWGTSFILMKLGSFTPEGEEMFSPMQLAALRMGIAGVVLIPFVFIHKKKITKKNIGSFFVVSFFGSGMPALMFAISITKLYSSYTGMLNALTPIFAMVVSILLFSVKPSKNDKRGLLIGLLGAVVLILADQGVGSSENIWYAMFVVIATLGYGISANVIKNKLDDMPSILISALSFIIVGIPYIVYLFRTDFLDRLNSNPYGFEALGYISILSIIGTALAVYIYSVLIKQTNVFFASSVTYVIPVFAVMWGVLLEGDPITIYHILGLVIVFGGVYLVNKK